MERPATNNPQSGSGAHPISARMYDSGMLMVDGDGRRLEVIRLDRCDGNGPQAWIRVSWHHRILLGNGYYRHGELAQALALVDVETLVEVIPHPASQRKHLAG